MPRLGSLAVKVQLIAGDEPAFGPGRADILAAIEREGSISAAGRSLGMSYRFTWRLVDSMNRCFRDRLVTTAVGGQRGGRAELTPAGTAVLAAYRALEKQLVDGADGEPLRLLRASLREECGPSPTG